MSITTSADYHTQHRHVKRHRGSAKAHWCWCCHKRRATNWATIHGTDGTDPLAHYVPLCRPCHHEYDEIVIPQPSPERRARGSRDGNAKLTEESVAEIRRRLAAGETQLSLAVEFGMTRHGIAYAARKGWKHVA